MRAHLIPYLFKNLKYMKKLTLIAVFIVVISFIVLSLNKDKFTKNITIKVNEKERVLDNNSSKYLIFTDKGVYQITDQLLFGKFNSSDLYGELKIDSTYTITTFGIRIPVLSLYPDIVEIK